MSSRRVEPRSAPRELISLAYSGGCPTKAGIHAPQSQTGGTCLTAASILSAPRLTPSYLIVMCCMLPPVSAAHSCSDDLGQLSEQVVKILAKQLAGATETTALAERWVEQLSRFDREAGRKVIADQAQPVSCSSVNVRPAFSCWSSHASKRCLDLIGERGSSSSSPRASARGTRYW